ncbi:hypothetical protein [Flavobacterium foetidum]|uniref:hypothetical protein n=1 Tax=Flavobacterium foetidum TaxID=2026681 RepID=UPI0010756549|nr:hypothetical protein [Flavobacterium foetidum]KAF2513837.1 hypothetical protein E0W73_13500 [Flavobacterium foetidum]
MRSFILLLLLISTTSFSQTNKFTGTWSSENCKNCSKEYFLKITIAQSNYKISGTAEVVSDNKKLQSEIFDITGVVYTLGDKAQIKIEGKNNISASAVLFISDEAMQFSKRGGADIVPKEVILSKLYE